MIFTGTRLRSKDIPITAFFLILLTLCGCSPLQVAPIQMGRVAQLETFRHTFDFGEVNSSGSSSNMDDFASATRDINQRIERKFTRLLGKANWQTLKDLYGLSDIRDELVDKSIYIKGVAQFYISIDPFNHQRFLLEGTGKYFLIREKTGAILLSGDFFAVPTSYEIADLENGELPVNVTLFTTRIPAEVTYYHEAIVKYLIRIETSRKKDNIYRLKYDAVHDVHLLQTQDEPITKENKLGELTLDNKAQGPKKLLDLRGIKSLRSDY